MQSYGKNLIKANKITKTKAKNDVFGNFGVTGRGYFGGKTNASEQITAARMPQKGTTLRGRGYGLRVTGYGLRVMGYGLRENALMDVQCSYNPPTIPLQSPDYGSTQLRAAQRVHQLACRMAEPTKRKSKRKKRTKKKKNKKKKRCALNVSEKARTHTYANQCAALIII